ncbi:MAG: EpsG family protein [Bacillota bacterium]|nr:EpsG family protein [Bacillota bacterium]
MIVYLMFMFLSAAPLFIWENKPFACSRLEAAQKNGKRVELLFFVLGYAATLLPYVLRSTAVGADTLRYRSHFYSTLFFSKYEPGFYLFSSFLRLFTSSFEVYLLIITTLSQSLLLFAMHRNAQNRFISILSYHCFFLFALGFSALRQFAAFALVACGLMIILEDRRSRKHVAIGVGLLLLAASFHITAAIVLLILIPIYIDLNRKFAILAASLSALLFLLRDPLLSVLAPLLRPDTQVYAQYTNKWGLSTILFVALMLLLNYLAGQGLTEATDEKRKEESLDIPMRIANLLFVCLIFNLFYSWVPAHFRLTQYFYLALVLLLGRDERIRGKKQLILAAILILYYSYILLKDNIAIIPYRFMF